jgi:hypothetical protein
MSHELLRLPNASPDQLDLAMGILVGGGVVMALFLLLLLKWSQRKEAQRHREVRPRVAKGSRRARRRPA